MKDYKYINKIIEKQLPSHALFYWFRDGDIAVCIIPSEHGYARGVAVRSPNDTVNRPLGRFYAMTRCLKAYKGRGSEVFSNRTADIVLKGAKCPVLYEKVASRSKPTQQERDMLKERWNRQEKREQNNNH